MSIDVTWDDDSHRIINWQMHPGFTWDEFGEAVDQSAAMMNTVSHRVDLLAIAHATILPSADAMAPFRRSVTQRLANNNGGYLILVGAGRVVPVLLNFLKGSIPKETLTFLDVKFFPTEDQARRFIAQHAGDTIP